MRESRLGCNSRLRRLVTTACTTPCPSPSSPPLSVIVAVDARWCTLTSARRTHLRRPVFAADRFQRAEAATARSGTGRRKVCRSADCAARNPAMPWTPMPGAAELEQRYTPAAGVRHGSRRTTGRRSS